MITMKRAIAVLTAFILVLSVVSGCNKTTPGTSDSSSTESSEAISMPEPGNPTLPLTDTPVTLKGYYPMASEALQVLTSWNDNEGQKELARRTGVTIEWQNPVIGQDTEAFNVMVNSGSLPDIIVYNFSAYPGGYTAALNDGLILDIKDLVDRYAPNYRVLREENEQFRKESMTDDGKLPGFYTYNTYEAMRPWGGFMIRKDWLNDLDLPMPVTYDDWYTTLKAFKEEKGAQIPFVMANTGLFMANEFISGFQIAGLGQFYQVDGVVKYGPTQPAFKDYLTMVNKWYKEGLIGEDFMTEQSPFYAPNASNIASGKSGIFWAAYPLLSMYSALTQDEDFELAPILSPVKNAGDELHFNGLGNAAFIGGFGVAISSSSQYPELAARWCDYQYSPDGYLLSNFGIEGESYEMVDGEPKFLQSIIDDPNGITKYVYRYGSTIYDLDVEHEQLAPDSSKPFINEWSKAGYDYYITAALAPTTDESERYTAIMADVTTFLQENVLNFITGDRPLEEFDDFVATLESMEIDEATQIIQAQLDRYKNR